MTKKEQQKIRKQLHKLLDIYIDTNGFIACDREETGNHPTVFFRLNGHVNCIDVDLHEKGWYPYADEDCEIKVILNHEIPTYKIEQFEDRCRKALEAYENEKNA